MTTYEQTIAAIVKDRKVLSQPCKPVTDFEAAKPVIKEMRRVARILDKNPKLRCLGIAANQVGFDVRIILLKTQRGKFEVFINPELIKGTGHKDSYETCFSAPGCFKTIDRFVTVQVSNNGMPFRTLSGIKAVAFQHELDHLNGKILGG